MRPAPIANTGEIFDFLIVGGGSAGCVLANRLSADPSKRVMLIEAGADTPPGMVPDEILDSYPMPLFYGDTYIWPGLMASANRGSQGPRLYEQARVMGGGSSINVQSANRGLPRDYDEWSALGARGWAWDDVLPYFRKLEQDIDFDGELHGKSGFIPIRRILPDSWPSFPRKVAGAFQSRGHILRQDQNGDFEDGIFPAAFSNIHDRRVSTAAGYLDAETRRRRNLEIVAGTRVTNLRIRDRTVQGVVMVDRDGVLRTVHARNIVLTAGALQSPAILMRAGIGPGEDLKRLGIDVIVDLPGVGKNLRDHPALTFCQYLYPHLRFPASYRRASLLCVRYSSNVPGGSPSDMFIGTSARAAWHALGRRLGLYFLWCNRPHSVGTLQLQSTDPDVYPKVDLNLLSDERDLRRMMAGVRHLVGTLMDPGLNPDINDIFPATFSPGVRRLSLVSTRNKWITSLAGRMLDAPPSLRQWMLRTFMLKGASLPELLASDKKLEKFVRESVFGVWHASGTCRMGAESDRLAVVDTSGKVFGIKNLWVSDASIMPCLPSANTNIPTIMIAEKISDALLGVAPNNGRV
jgi:5-(hydroxymethyl)furfural/furfural oxidase